MKILMKLIIALLMIGFIISSEANDDIMYSRIIGAINKNLVESGIDANEISNENNKVIYKSRVYNVHYFKSRMEKDYSKGTTEKIGPEYRGIIIEVNLIGLDELVSGVSPERQPYWNEYTRMIKLNNDNKTILMNIKSGIGFNEEILLTIMKMKFD